MSEMPDGENVRRAVWAITDRVRWGTEREVTDGESAFVAHDAEGVVLIAGAGKYAEQLRVLMALWDAEPEHKDRPPTVAVLS